MHATDTKSRFIELRAQGWSLARNAAPLNVAKRTLVDWNQPAQTESSTLKAVELEALQEKLHRFCTIFAPEKVFWKLPSLPYKDLPMCCVGLVQFVPGHLLDREKSKFGKEKVKEW